jgi:hypothetical protein
MCTSLPIPATLLCSMKTTSLEHLFDSLWLIFFELRPNSWTKLGHNESKLFPHSNDTLLNSSRTFKEVIALNYSYEINLVLLCSLRFVVASFPHIMLCIQQACCSTLALCCTGGGWWWPPSLISCSVQYTASMLQYFSPMLYRWRLVVASFSHIMLCTVYSKHAAVL